MIFCRVSSYNTPLRDIEFTETPGILLVKDDNIQMWDINSSIPVTIPVSSGSNRSLRANSVLRKGSNELVMYNKEFVAIRKLTEMQEVIDFYRAK